MDDALRVVGDDRSHDAEVAAALYRRYRRALIRYCSARLPNPADAEDAAHDTFVRAIQALPRLDADVPVWPWLATIAANVCADAHRRGGRWERAAPFVIQEAPDLDEQVAARVRRRLLVDALDTVTPRQRVPVYLKDLVGWTYQEIARAQGMSVGAVRSTLLRGRRALRHRVEVLARSRGQWPLPVVVRLWDRARTASRAGRAAAARTSRVGLQSGELTSYLIGFVTTLPMLVAMTAAGATGLVGAFPHPAEAGVPPAAAVVVREAAQRTAGMATFTRSARPQSPLGRQPPGRDDPHREHHAEITAPAGVESTHATVKGATIRIDSTDEAIYVHDEATVEVPYFGRHQAGGFTNVACQTNDVKRASCRLARALLRLIPDS